MDRQMNGETERQSDGEKKDSWENKRIEKTLMAN